MGAAHDTTHPLPVLRARDCSLTSPPNSPVRIPLAILPAPLTWWRRGREESSFRCSEREAGTCKCMSLLRRWVTPPDDPVGVGEDHPPYSLRPYPSFLRLERRRAPSQPVSNSNPPLDQENPQPLPKPGRASLSYTLVSLTLLPLLPGLKRITS